MTARASLAAAALLLLSACSAIKGGRDQMVRLTLQPPPTEAPTEAPTDTPAPAVRPLLALDTFTDALAVDTTELLYRTSAASGALHTYDDTHSWVSSPAAMLRELARDVLPNALGVRVADYPSEEFADLRLRLRVLHFEEIRPPNSDEGQALVVLEYQLLERNPDPSSEAPWEPAPPQRVEATAPIHHTPDHKFRSLDAEAYATGMATAAAAALAQLSAPEPSTPAQ